MSGSGTPRAGAAPPIWLWWTLPMAAAGWMAMEAIAPGPGPAADESSSSPSLPAMTTEDGRTVPVLPVDEGVADTLAVDLEECR